MFIFNSDTESLILPSIKDVYGSSEGKIVIFTIESTRWVGDLENGDFHDMKDYLDLVSMIENHADIKFSFGHDSENYDVDYINIGESGEGHLKENHHFVKVTLK